MKTVHEKFFNRYAGWIIDRTDGVEGIEMNFIPETPDVVIKQASYEANIEHERQNYISGHC